VMNTDDSQYGGSDYLATLDISNVEVKSEKTAWNDCPYSIVLNLPPLSLIMLKWNKS
jgi:1,4-alpha-glucan branching enzyme